MENMTQMQRHIEALNKHIDQRAREAAELEANHFRTLWKTNLYWLICVILTAALAVEFNKDTVVERGMDKADLTSCQNRLFNTVEVLKMVDEERNAYAEATEWFLEHSTPRK